MSEFANGAKKHYYHGTHGPASEFSLGGELMSFAEFLVLPAFVAGALGVGQLVEMAIDGLENHPAKYRTPAHQPIRHDATSLSNTPNLLGHRADLPTQEQREALRSRMTRA